MDNSNAFAEVTEIMQGYFDGLYHADTVQLATVFHPDARYVNMIEGDYMNKSLAEYFEMVDRRTSPASKGEPRDDRIFSIEFGGSRMAFVRASMTMMLCEYLDFLTLTRDHNGWRIMTKIFTYIPQIQEA
ncbi:nuclear transport factor 2 family protein [Sneathiella marina]|uniref:Nuclear transport factor 2 family protein n=1 Tax=Sneathiella marina TaxID=2950108 RepID=A0ABY4W4C5_9PROT|nr:nuclear transport factor 2 family protein [Sneathiella marina]USG62038.1 nuclear transport factor 2 family protein [Sneathiella marina]